MAKQKSSPKSEKYRNGVPQGVVSRDLKSVKTAEQFVPTPKEPVRLRYKMAGGC